MQIINTGVISVCKDQMHCFFTWSINQFIYYKQHWRAQTFANTSGPFPNVKLMRPKIL